jgi:hypothetical protein
VVHEAEFLELLGKIHQVHTTVPGFDAGQPGKCVVMDRSKAHRPGRARAVMRDRAYFALMGTCIAAVILAWTVVRLYSVTAAVVISVCAGLIPPVAAIVANAGDESSRRR